MTPHLWATSLVIAVHMCTYAVSAGEYDRALFVKYDDIRKAREIHSKVSQVSPNSMDQTVDHILMWLQSRYQNQQNQRQDILLRFSSVASSLEEYLILLVLVCEVILLISVVVHLIIWKPRKKSRQDSDQQRPRPFSMTQPQEYRGYLPPQSPPQPEFLIPTTSQLPPSSGSPFYLNIAADQNRTPLPPPSREITQPPPYPVTTDEPSRPANYPFPSQQTQQPSADEQSTSYPITNPPYVSDSYDQLQQSNPNDLQQSNSPVDLQQPNNSPVDQQQPNNSPVDLQQPSANDVQSNPDDALHPPHIHQMNVQCSKDTMTIDVEFNKPYDGVVYSKGFYNNPECRYVNPNSGQTKYSFRVMLNSCGTHFVDEFSTGKQAYLENVLVVQNEPGIQEVWDVIRSVRCQWEGNLNKALSIALNIGMLNQEVVTFSGDTATARLDIQAGKGPFAPIASGLVKIGETMTLVVTVDGDPGFNILVRDCVARDNDPESGNLLQLTDARGCVAKPKLFGSFQTTTNPATGSLIAYAYFQAFKFPDVMDLLIECNVELCKVNCEPCAELNQKIDPGRKRRDVPANNTANAYGDGADSMTLVGRVHVYSPDDLLADNFNRTDFLDPFQALTAGDRTLCISSKKFYMTYSFMVAATLISSGMSLVLWVRLQRKSYKE